MNKWPVYVSLGNIDPMITSQPSDLASILVALLPVSPYCQYEGHEKTNAVNKQQISSWELLKQILELIFSSLDTLVNYGKHLLCMACRMRQCYPAICTWMADDFENIDLHSMKQVLCLVRQAAKSSFGEGNSSWWQLRDYQLYFQKMIVVT